MNPLTQVRNITKLNEREIELGISAGNSWHNDYRDSAWVFIGGLPFGLTEGDVICVFSQYGEIVNINLVRDSSTGKSKGYCFLCYEDQRSTDLAVDNLNGVKVLKRTLRVDHVRDYKPPKDHKDTDDLTRMIRDKGVAPRTPSASPELLPPLVKKQPSSPPETKAHKVKKEKRKKKKRKASGSDLSESEEEEVDKKRRSKKRRKSRHSRSDSEESDEENEEEEEESANRRKKHAGKKRDRHRQKQHRHRRRRHHSSSTSSSSSESSSESSSSDSSQSSSSDHHQEEEESSPERRGHKRRHQHHHRSRDSSDKKKVRPARGPLTPPMKQSQQEHSQSGSNGHGLQTRSSPSRGAPAAFRYQRRLPSSVTMTTSVPPHHHHHHPPSSPPALPLPHHNNGPVRLLPPGGLPHHERMLPPPLRSSSPGGRRPETLAELREEVESLRELVGSAQSVGGRGPGWVAPPFSPPGPSGPAAPRRPFGGPQQRRQQQRRGGPAQGPGRNRQGRLERRFSGDRRMRRSNGNANSSRDRRYRQH